MPEIHLKHIVSCNSEDSKFPADNLVKPGTYKKWKCLPGEKEGIVLLQLERASSILSLDIGNENSAFIEVLVARSTSNQDHFQVLLPASSFMNPSESRLGSNPNRVRLFKSEHLNSSVARQKWDRVKVVCTQPFNKNASYGISFIRLHEEAEPPKPQAMESAIPDTQGLDTSLGDTQPLNFQVENIKPTQPVQIGSFTLKPEDEDDIDTGSLFTKRKQLSPEAPSTVAKIYETNAAPASSSNIRADGPPSAKKSKLDTWKKTKEHSSTPPAQAQPSPNPSKVVITPNPPAPKPSVKKALKRVPFEKLLEGVTFALSGFVNPQRSSLREKACDMGAKYSPDWKRGCTHLVCAVAGTPKFNQVKGNGNIVKASWVEDCYKNKKRYAWRKFALDKSDQTDAYSDEEVVAGDDDNNLAGPSSNNQSVQNQPVAAVASNGKAKAIETMDDDSFIDDKDEDDDDYVYDLTTDPESSDLDTDEEIKRVSNPKKKKETTEEKNWSKSSDKLAVDDNGLPLLPEFFSENVFLLFGDFSPYERKQVVRFITAFGGKLEKYMGDSVTHVITRQPWSEAFDKASSDNPSILFMSPEWILKCGKDSKLVPYENYLIKKE